VARGEEETLGRSIRDVQKKSGDNDLSTERPAGRVGDRKNGNSSIPGEDASIRISIAVQWWGGKG